MQHPPHLPPPACNVQTHYKLRSLTKLLFLVFVSSLSGVTATLVTVAWVIPTNSPIDSYARVQNLARRDVQETVDPLLVQQTRQRQIQIFDVRKKVRGSYYAPDALLAEGIFLSSDGWAVVYQGSAPLPDVSHWEGIDFQGVTHRVEKSVQTPDAIYVRFDGEGFRIMPFASWNDMDIHTSLWSLSVNRWETVTIDSEKRVVTGSVSPADTLARYVFLPNTPKKSILLNDKGEFVGFGDTGEIRVSAWKVDYELRSILNSGKITYRSFPWKGFIISRADDGHGLREAAGFYVDSVTGKSSTSTVQAGDLVLSLDNEPISAIDLPRQMLFAPDRLPVRVMRDGAELTVIADKADVILDRERK